jgi:hypothetical protein
VCRSVGGSPTSFRDVGVLDSGDPNFSIWVVEVKARAGEVVRAGTLHAQAIALLAIVGYGSHFVLLETKFLPFGELLLPLLFEGRPVRLDLGCGGGCREGGGEGIDRRLLLASCHEDCGWVAISWGLDGVRVRVAAKEGEDGVIFEVAWVRD